MIELLSSIVVEFSRLIFFRRCGRDYNSEDVAIIDVALEDIRICSLNSTFLISKSNQNKSMNHRYLWNSILHRKFCNH